MSPGVPVMVRVPSAAAHFTGATDVASVQSTTSLLPAKHGSLTVVVAPESVTWPAQLAPELIVKPPIGLHDDIVVG